MGKGTGTAAPKKKGGGGFFHSLGHIASQAGQDLYHAAVDSPAGLYQVGSAVAHDIRKHPYDVISPGSFYYHEARNKHSAMRQVAAGFVEQAKQDVTHPLRHPGYTALDALALASLGAGTAARVGTAARFARAGETGRAFKALTHGPEPGTLEIRSGNYVKTLPASRSTIGRFVQSQINDLRNAYPNWHIGLRTQTQRVQRLVEQEQQHHVALGTAASRELEYRGRTIGRYSPRGLALRAVAEQTPVEMIQKAWQDALAETTNARTRSRLEKRIALAERAKKYVAVQGDKVSIDPHFKKLAVLEDLAREVSKANDVSLIDEGLAQSGMLHRAIAAPGRIYRGAQYTPKTGLVGAEDFTASEGFHVGQPTRGKIRGGGGGTVAEGNVANAGARERGALRNPLTGSGMRAGRTRQDVPRIIAENVNADQRTIARLKTGRYLYEYAADTPAGLKNPQAIRDPALFGKETPAPIREALDAANLEPQGLVGLAEQRLHDYMFPEDIQNDQLLRQAEIEAVPGYRWIERDLTPAGVPSGPVTKGGKLVVGINDAINNASKFAILYLKPAYIVPNVTGNTFLTLTQQGVFAPVNVAKAVRLHRAIGARDTLLIDTLMGEGIAGSLKGVGAGTRAVTLGAHVYGKVVDLPFRRASFIFEARKAGFDTAAKLKKLLHDDANQAKLHEVQFRANRALIDYGNLTPFEQSVIRRVLFFYPWLKGSVRYAKDYLIDHPQQAALIGALGQYGQKTTAEQLGPLPSWGQGLFRVGGTDQTPLTVNPAAAGILSQPAQLGAVLAKAAGGNLHGSGYDLQQLLTPALGSALAAIAGENTFGGAAPRNVNTFVSNLYGGIPGLTLYQRLTQDQSKRTYPMTPLEALMQFLVGGVYPRHTNRGKLNQAHAREQKEG